MSKRSRTGNILRRTDTGVSAGRRNTTRRRNARVTVPRNKMAFPQSMRTKLRYVERREFVLTSTTALKATYRANDLYDPTYTMGGHQPRGFDELMEVYGTFTVMGAKINAQFMYEGYLGPTNTGTAGNLIQTLSMNSASPTDTPALPPIALGIHKGVEQLSSGTAEEQMEKERTVWTFLTPGDGIKNLSYGATQKEFFGKQAIVGSAGYTGTAAKSPTEELYFEVWAGRCDDNFQAGTIRVPVYVTIEYDAVFTDPKTLAAS